LKKFKSANPGVIIPAAAIPYFDFSFHFSRF
jgi:hypothetical protein